MEAAPKILAREVAHMSPLQSAVDAVMAETWSGTTAQLAALERLVTEARKVAQPAEPVAWRDHAAAWLLRKAAEQAVNNAKWPAHAEAYPNWTRWVDDLRRLAEALQAEQEAAPFGVDAAPKFQHTYCSHCGGEFGPGNAGFSHCEDHAARAGGGNG